MRRNRHISVPHVHPDVDVTLERVDAFAAASREEQLAALSALRIAAANDDHVAIIALESLVISAFALFAVILLPESPPLSSMLARVLLGSIIVVMLLLVFAPTIINTARALGRRERARVWLTAYECELQRRWAQRGRTARTWQHRH